MIFGFSSYLGKEIHNGLIGIDKGKVSKHFGWYSMLMCMCLFKEVSYFEKEMKLVRNIMERNFLSSYGVHICHGIGKMPIL